MTWQLHAIIANDLLADRRREAEAARLVRVARSHASRAAEKPAQTAPRRRVAAPARG